MRAVLLFLILTSFALTARADGDISSFIGYLVDRDAIRMAEQQISMESTLAAYHRKTALQSLRGFALISNGQLYELDTRGNNLAKGLLADTLNDQPLFVMIQGRLSDGKIVVEQLSDISVQQF